jgi:hypothetical protein
MMCRMHGCPEPATMFRLMVGDDRGSWLCQAHAAREDERRDLLIELSGHVSSGLVMAMQDLPPSALLEMLDELRAKDEK